MQQRKFAWNSWDFDCDGEAYIIAKDQCSNREDIPGWIVQNDNLDPECMNPVYGKGEYIAVEDVEEGWCKYQVRTDWENGDGEPQGGYFVKEGKTPPQYQYGEKCGQTKPGWFPVWIVRKGNWY